MGDISSQRLRVKPTPTLLLLFALPPTPSSLCHHHSSTTAVTTPGFSASSSWIRISGNSSRPRWPVLGPDPTPIRAASRYRCTPEPPSLSEPPSFPGLAAWAESSYACDSGLTVFLLGKSSLDGIPAHPSAALSSRHHHLLRLPVLLPDSLVRTTLHYFALIVSVTCSGCRFWSSTLDVQC